MQNVLHLDDLPDELLELINNNLSIRSKINGRLVSQVFKNTINYMKIRIHKFNIKLCNIMIPFPVMDSIKRYIQLGILIEWQSRLSLRRYNKNHIGGKYAFIKDYLFKHLGGDNISSNYSSIWFFEAIIDWAILEKEGIIMLKRK